MIRSITTTSLAIALLLTALPASSEGPTLYSGARPDGHAPLGVMGEHVHSKGELMVSYRYAHMAMKHNLVGTDRVSVDDVLSDYLVSPTSMDMDMHMFGLMYAPLDDLTVMVMIPWLRKSMDHETRMQTAFTTTSSGIGDLKLSGLYRFLRTEHHSVHANLGVSFPTGSIEARDFIGSSPTELILPYPMQLGSGSFGLLPGITYNGQTRRWSWGGQALGTIWLNENSRDYKVGNRYDLTAWGAGRWTDWVSTSLRFTWRQWFNYSGADPALNPNVVPTADTKLRGGERFDGSLGVNFYVPRGALRNFRIAVEAGLPLYQSLDGPQLDTRWWLVTGLQYSF